MVQKTQCPGPTPFFAVHWHRRCVRGPEASIRAALISSPLCFYLAPFLEAPPCPFSTHHSRVWREVSPSHSPSALYPLTLPLSPPRAFLSCSAGIFLTSNPCPTYPFVHCKHSLLWPYGLGLHKPLSSQSLTPPQITSAYFQALVSMWTSKTLILKFKPGFIGFSSSKEASISIGSISGWRWARRNYRLSGRKIPPKHDMEATMSKNVFYGVSLHGWKINVALSEFGSSETHPWDTSLMLLYIQPSSLPGHQEASPSQSHCILTGPGERSQPGKRERKRGLRQWKTAVWCGTFPVPPWKCASCWDN